MKINNTESSLYLNCKVKSGVYNMKKETDFVLYSYRESVKYKLVKSKIKHNQPRSGYES